MDAYETICREIDARLEKGEPVRLLLDGPCATGKTTLASKLGEAYGAPVIHMDDFYVPWKEKTPERLSLPGGNADWERFLAEVTEPMLAGGPIVYLPFLPRTQSLGEAVTVEVGRLTIIEGAYACHERLRHGGNLKVKINCPADVRLWRLRLRDPERYPDFLKLWIPLENLYFSEMATDSVFDLVLDA